MKQVVLITGASSGLGLALATLLQQRGYTVFGTSRQPASPNFPFTMLQMDVLDEASIATAITDIIAREGQLDILINNAGLGIAGPVEQLQLASIQRVFDTNLYGVVRTTQAVLPVMRRQGHGRIINISSIAAEVALPYRALYAASKAAVDRLTDGLRMEVAPFGIQCCIVHPGDIKTNINANRIMEYDPQVADYRESYERVAKAINQGVDHGKDPAELADQIAGLLLRKNWKKSYAMGRPMENIALVIKRILPGTWFERIIKQYSHL
ncbi:MAG: SDR family oxidoreductase [Lewinellaceae bacterium]|nr:SDR family oxidoreductase [Lewinellaceae bacterium]